MYSRVKTPLKSETGWIPPIFENLKIQPPYFSPVLKSFAHWSAIYIIFDPWNWQKCRTTLLAETPMKALSYVVAYWKFYPKFSVNVV